MFGMFLQCSPAAPLLTHCSPCFLQSSPVQLVPPCLSGMPLRIPILHDFSLLSAPLTIHLTCFFYGGMSRQEASLDAAKALIGFGSDLLCGIPLSFSLRPELLSWTRFSVVCVSPCQGPIHSHSVPTPASVFLAWIT